MAPSHPKPTTSNPKLPRLPPNTKVTKRPLPRPPIPSKYASSSTPKVVYVSTKTPFLSAVKRVEKLLRQSDKRLVQSATDLTQKRSREGHHSRRFGGGREDEVLEIAREVDRMKRRRGGGGGGGEEEEEGDGAATRGGEEVVIKGAGKAIAKVMDLGVWFQERGQVYKVRLETSSVGAVDDIEVPEDQGQAHEEDRDGGEKREQEDVVKEDIPETRIRYLGVLEVFVSLR